jgi:hypothetical protein
MTDANEKTDLAAQLALQGLRPADGDIEGILSMSRDLAESSVAVRRKYSYSLESLSGFSLKGMAEKQDE